MVKVLSKRLWGHFQEDSLFRNSLYLMLSTGVMAFFGFFFWIVVARLFSPGDVGIATTLISVMTLIGNFSLLGFNISLIRYLPKSDERNEKINSVLILVTLASIVASVLFLSGLKIFSPKLLFLQTNLFYILSFILFVIGLSLNTIIDSVFIAYRATGNILIKNTALSILKLILPLLLIFLGSYGIFSSVAVATLVSTLMSLGILIYKYTYRPSFSFNADVVKKMAVFSGGNYLAGFLSLTPTLLLPILIINKLNAETAAYYYIASMILGFLTIIPSATTNSLLAEGSYDNTELKQHFIKSSKIIYLFLVPAVFLIVFFGNIILHAFGKNYADEAFSFLQIISFSTLFMAVTSLASALLRVRHQMKELIATNALGVIFVLGLTYLFIPQGLIGVGWGWLWGQILLALVYLAVVGKKELVFILFKRIRGR